MRHRLGLVMAFFILHLSSHAQDTGKRFIYLPGRLAFQPLAASHQEPRVGLRKDIGSSRMKVDIGSSLDLLEFRPATDSSEFFRVGIDFFTYALSTSSEGLRLQIDAVDGFFGGHVSYRNVLDETSAFVGRLRLLHISAHFLDGHFSNATQTWKDGRAPIPFTRDFGELLLGYEFETSWSQTLAYAGFSYATLIRPTVIQRTEWFGGVELKSKHIIDSLFDRTTYLYVAGHLNLRGIPRYIGTTNLESGIKFGDWKESGLRIYLSYYNGLDAFSQYYDVRRENWGLGFAFDFW